MRTILALLVLGLAASASGPASAEVVYPWCAYYSGKVGGTNCGFTSFQQCLWSVSGNGGFCNNNPLYALAPAAPPRRRHHLY